MHSTFCIIQHFIFRIDKVFADSECILRNERMSLGKDEKNVGIYSDDEAIP